MEVAVTGGAGFIGANLTKHLASLGDVVSIKVIDDLSTGDVKNLDGVPKVEFLEASILDSAAMSDAFDGVDAIVHLAARPSVARSIEDPVLSNEVNATGTLRVLDAARRAGNIHTILASSSSVYGANSTLPKSEALRPEPMSPYAVSKLAAESYASAYHYSYHLPVLPFRFFNVYGPMQTAGHAYAAVIPAFLEAALAGQPLPLHGDGHQSRDFTYVGSVCTVIDHAIRRHLTSPYAVNLAFGSRRTVNEVVVALSRYLEKDLEVVPQGERRGDVRHSQADSSKLSELLPDIIPIDFDLGLKETIEWYRAQREPVTTHAV